MAVSALERKIFEMDYQNYLLTGDHEIAESIWQNGNNKNELEWIIESSTSFFPKLIAAEILAQKGIQIVSRFSQKLLETYTNALRDSSQELDTNYRFPGNLWGFINEEDDPGLLGERIIQFGHPMVPFLKRLLNEKGMVLYEGSEEATIGNALQCRIKDFAAYYISKIVHVPFIFHQDKELRDTEIEQLKVKLAEDDE